ncbi:MAG: spore coat protein [Clostridiales bacterium]|nr:spore coat protein [Clostridiales bacterium]
MDDKTILWDCLKDQKFLSGQYAQMATETVCGNLLQDTMKICHDEVRANHDIFNVMSQKGWYPVEYAQQDEINRAKTMANQLESGL